jgi:hypothetical protein
VTVYGTHARRRGDRPGQIRPASLVQVARLAR